MGLLVETVGSICIYYVASVDTIALDHHIIYKVGQRTGGTADWLQPRSF